MASYGETLFLLETLLKYDILTAKAEKAGIEDLDKFLDSYESHKQDEPNEIFSGFYYPANICVPASHETVRLQIVDDVGHRQVIAYYDSKSDIWYTTDDVIIDGRIVGWKPASEDARLLL